jgi:probable rRNA maturation factor
MTPDMDVMIRSPRWKARPRCASVVKRAIAAAASAVPTPSSELAIVLTDDSGIRAINRDWRGQDRPTNVLSFPANAAGMAPRAVRHLGDIVIAYQTVAREAAAEGKPFGHHLAHLAVHGFLHLLGYDHETERDARRMERLETKILARLKVPDPYAAAATRN